MRVELHFGDITEYDADCIVNAARPSLQGGGGVDGAIHKAAGVELKEFCKTLGGCAVGEAKISPAFNLPCKNIIHTVGPRYLFKVESEIQDLRNCYLNSLEVAKEKEFKTLVFSNISTGAYGFQKDLASIISFETVASFLSENEFPKKVVFCCFDLENLQLYLNLIKENLI
jgi:O-acetyl-ADP-ribose deacetylase (regulator of RNase III)